MKGRPAHSITFTTVHVPCCSRFLYFIKANTSKQIANLNTIRSPEGKDVAYFLEHHSSKI